MIAQSLGGMEVVVGMSLLAGGLVLDKSKLVQGSKLPIKYLFASSPMPLTSNVYHVGQSIDTISRHDCCDHTSSRIDGHEPYPALRTLVERLEGVSRDADCQECYKNSALFAQFLLSFLTYVLLSYFVRLHCANIHIHLPSFSFLMT